MHPIGQAARQISQIHLDGVNKGTKIRSLNRQSASRFALGIPLMFSRKLTVWDPQQQAHVYTSVSKSQWKKVKGLARRAEGDIGALSSRSLATRKKLALEIIRKSGDASRLSVLDRASAWQLCLIARGLARYGHDANYRKAVFEALGKAQDQWQAMSMDPQTLDMVNKFVADERSDPDKAEQSKKQLYSHDYLARLEGAKPRTMASRKEFPDMFRKFLADLFSEDERDRNQVAGGGALDREERLKQVFRNHPGVTRYLMTIDPSVSDPNRDRDIGRVAASCGVSEEIIRGIAETAWSMGPGDSIQPSPGQMKLAIDKYPAPALSSLARGLDAEVQRYDLQKLGTYLKANIPRKAGNFGQFLNAVFDQYFSKLSIADRRAVISAYLRESGSEDSEEKRLVAALKGSGPYLLKILQLMGDTVSTDTESGRTLKQALGELKDDLLPIAPDIQRAMVTDLLRANESTIRDLKNLRSLGAASVGETLMAEATLANGETREVVLKLLKPGVDQRAARERAVMETIARDIPGMQETFAGIADQIDRELDLTREATNVERAAVYRRAGLGYIQPVKAVERLDPTQEFMFMERAAGGTVKDTLAALGRQDSLPAGTDALARHQAARDRLKQGAELSQRLQSLSRVWLNQALFEKGFFHGDLHSGNMMYGDTARQAGLLTLIDFGNAGTLSRQDQANMLKLMLAAENRYPQQFVDTLAMMVGPQSQRALNEGDNRNKLIEKVGEVFSDPTMSGSKRMLEAFNQANTFDVAIPNAISNFSRSQNMLDLTIKDINAINLANWETLNEAGVQDVPKPQPVSLSDEFRTAVRSRKRQIIMLTGREGWNMRNQNAELPLRPVSPPVPAAEPEKPSDELLSGSAVVPDSNSRQTQAIRQPIQQLDPEDSRARDDDRDFNNWIAGQMRFAQQAAASKGNERVEDQFIKSFVSSDDGDQNQDSESEQDLDYDPMLTRFIKQIYEK